MGIICPYLGPFYKPLISQIYTNLRISKYDSDLFTVNYLPPLPRPQLKANIEHRTPNVEVASPSFTSIFDVLRFVIRFFVLEIGSWKLVIGYYPYYSLLLPAAPWSPLPHPPRSF